MATYLQDGKVDVARQRRYPAWAVLTARRYRFHWAMALGALCVASGGGLICRVAGAQRSKTSVARSALTAEARSKATKTSGPVVIDAPIEGVDPARAWRDSQGYMVDLSQGRRAVLTVEPGWQRATAALLVRYEIPRASVVVLDTDTGRVQVYASTSDTGANDLALDATPPAASVFKIVTASALLSHGVFENAVTCYSGGMHALHERDLVPDAGRDHECISLAEAFGRSANTVFARRAIERLSPSDLLAAAQAWGFGQAVPFDTPATSGSVDVPEKVGTGIDFARAAAGFGHSYLSPLHGAMIAQAIARGGEMQRPFIVDSVRDAQGTRLAVGASRAWRRAVSPEVASALSRMMTHSVSEGGTAFHAFHDPAGRPFLPNVAIGGKTGTLDVPQPYRAYTWFVGNAATPAKRVSFAVMIANGPVWRVRAPTLARQVLQIIYRGRASD